MLLAVEGGGFFSSSASGYSNGLALLLLGQKNEERPMKVSPWNQYRIVEPEVGSDPPLASETHRVPRGCPFFMCLGRASTRGNRQCPPKAGPTHQAQTLPDSSAFGTGEACATEDVVDNSIKKICLKSSLKKPPTDSVALVGQTGNEHDSAREGPSNVSCCTEKRKVQWTDASGGELAEIREFEVSDDGLSDDEFEDGRDKRCECVIQ